MMFSRDPFIYFYEDFLEKYDRSTRESRGVYYTPPPVVNFIIRAIDDILKGSFDIEQGLADRSRVTVLDFACGTGTFLVEVLERIFENVGGAGTAKADGYVRDHMLENIYGFEYLIAPYTIAHLKLGQYLTDKRHPLREGERFQVYLTNTLEPIEAQRNALLPELSHETEEAQRIKEKPILVITGNPPYSGHSRNNGPWAKGSVAAYRKVFETDDNGREAEKPLGERNPKWLQDDYVKFIRFAQMKMDEVDEGVVGIITNHSFLDNPTFRGMRQSLMRSFDQIYVLDLHGSTKKKEISPDGSKDENVFDIEQGVAISILVKKDGLARGVWRADWWGTRQEKYQSAATIDFARVQWERLEPALPQTLFTHRDNAAAAKYEQEWSVPDMFPVNSVGIVTARDNLTIHFNERELRTALRRFIALDKELAREAFGLGDDARDWKVEWAQADLKEAALSRDNEREILYRPFDRRVTFYTGRSRGFHCYPRGDVMRHLLRDNVGLVTSRLTKGETFKHVQVTDTIVEVISMSPTTSNNGFVFPLYLYPPDDDSKKPRNLAFEFGDDAFAGKARIENIAPEFRHWVDSRYGHAFQPEEILGFVYAVLHAPTYRNRYADFLRADFPRIPFPEEREAFELLSDLGMELMEAHLMRAVPHRGLGAPIEQGGNEVEKVRYSEAEGKVWINPRQGFANVPKPVWEFTIGGYQVIDKYLRSRKGRTLSLDEIENVEKVANVLAFTIHQMERIDETYCRAFPNEAAGRAADDIHSDPEIMGGEPVFRGTRIPIRAIADMLDADADVEELLKGYPNLDHARLEMARTWAKSNPRRDRPPSPSNVALKVLSRRRVPRSASRPGTGPSTKAKG